MAKLSLILTGVNASLNRRKSIKIQKARRDHNTIILHMTINHWTLQLPHSSLGD